MVVLRLLTISKINTFDLALQRLLYSLLPYKLNWQYKEDGLELTLTNGHGAISKIISYHEISLSNFNLLEFQIKEMRNAFKDGELE